jgi:hypothetical protein
MMLELDWREPFIDFIKDQKLPPGIFPKGAAVARIIRRSKGYVLVGDELYKRGSGSGIHLKCITVKEGYYILQEIHDGACGNHAASRTLVRKAFRSGFYWPSALADAEDLIR